MVCLPFNVSEYCLLGLPPNLVEWMCAINYVVVYSHCLTCFTCWNHWLGSTFTPKGRSSHFCYLEMKPSRQAATETFLPAFIFAHELGPILREGSEQYWLAFLFFGRDSSVEKLEKSWGCIVYQNGYIKILKFEVTFFSFSFPDLLNMDRLLLSVFL